MLSKLLVFTMDIRVNPISIQQIEKAISTMEKDIGDTLAEAGLKVRMLQMQMV